MMLDEPHIDVKALEAITAPTLVLASDHDVIRDEHTLEIYHHIPNSQLAIFPNATHMMPFDDPRVVQRHGGAVLPHAVREEGSDQGHAQVLGETARVFEAATAVNGSATRWPDPHKERTLGERLPSRRLTTGVRIRQRSCPPHDPFLLVARFLPTTP